MPSLLYDRPRSMALKQGGGFTMGPFKGALALTGLAGLIENLRRLAGDPALRASLGAANRAKAQAEFDEDKMLQRYAAIYGRAMGRPEFGR